MKSLNTAQKWQEASLKNVRVGQAVVPWCYISRGWVLPSRKIVKTKAEAIEAAEKIAAIMNKPTKLEGWKYKH